MKNHKAKLSAGSPTQSKPTTNDADLTLEEAEDMLKHLATDLGHKPAFVESISAMYVFSELFRACMSMRKISYDNMQNVSDRLKTDHEEAHFNDGPCSRIKEETRSFYLAEGERDATFIKQVKRYVRALLLLELTSQPRPTRTEKA